MRIHPALRLAVARDMRLAVLTVALFLISVRFLPILIPVLGVSAILAAAVLGGLLRECRP